MEVAPTGFIGWLTQYGQIIAFFAQIAFWLVLAVAALWSTLLFRKLVKAQVGESAEAAASDASAVLEPTDKAVSVEEFVE